MKSTKIILPLLFLLSLNACTEYWWSRGQAPGVGDLIIRSQERLDENLSLYGSERNEFAGLAVETRQSLKNALNAIENNESSSSLITKLEIAESKLMGLEGKVSVGSRAPYGELCGQLRAFSSSAKEGKNPTAKAFGLFTARTTFFMANELSVPAPNFG